ncbi:MAG: hypothetical protein L0221_15450 [Chloroflexi bacterium]|nr:hypothetical protein [Chloroflexota bacterium]
MHPLAHPRNAAIVGIAFIVVAILYGALAPVFGYEVEFAGVTMLFALGIAMALMAYVLIAGSPRE